MVSAYQGFCQFRRQHRVVNWLGYTSGVGTFLAVYLLGASVFPTEGVVPVAASATAAAAVAGLWLGTLYARAVGSPYGNVLLALVTPALVPWVVYTAPFPGASIAGGTWNHPEVVVPATLAGLFAVLWRIDRAYAGMDDASAWERSVMPHAFRVADGEYLARGSATASDRASAGPALNPRTEERLSVQLTVRGWLTGLVVAGPAIALAGYGRTTYDDRAFSGLMLLIMLALLHSALRLATDDS